MKVSGWGLSRISRDLNHRIRSPKPSFNRVIFVSGLLILSSSVLLSGCRRETPSSFDRNLAPETYIVAAPAESARAYYLITLRWGGEDPDGLVDHFEWAVTDSNKVPGQDTPEFADHSSSSGSSFVV